MKALKSCIVVLFFILYVLGLNAQSLGWQWALSGGGTSTDSGRGIVVDNSGNSYVTGHFIGEASFGATTLTSYGSYDIYLAKSDPSGNWLWAIKAGGTSFDIGFGVSMGTDGFVYVTGYFNGTATFGTHSITASGGGYEIFAAKADSLGSWIWVRKAGSTGHDEGWAITTDSDNNSYITGYSTGTPTFGTHSYSGSGGYDIFVAKIDSEGTWQWAVKAGSSGNDIGCGISLDSSSNILVCGYINSTASFGTHQIVSSGSNDIFIAKMDKHGTWQWARRAGGSVIDFAYAVVSNSNNDVFATGYFRGTGSFGSTNLTSSGGEEVFVAKLDSLGTWQWAVKAGGSGSDIGYGLVMDEPDILYFCGQFSGNANFGGIAKTSIGATDLFVAKISSDGMFQNVYTAGPGSAADIYRANDQAFYITGTMNGLGTFGSHNPPSAGSVDCFIAKLGSDTTLSTPPNPAIIQYPADGAINLSLPQTLQWIPSSTGAVPTGYRINLRTDNPPTNLLLNYDLGDSLSFTEPALNYGTTYYWQIIPYATGGDATGCPVWSFSTINPSPSFSVDSSNAAFGQNYVNIEAFKRIIVRNQGSGTGAITNIGITGSAYFDVAIPAAPVYPISVAPGDSLEIKIRFLPLETGYHYAQLSIVTDEPSALFVSLSGMAEVYTQSQITVIPNPLLHTALVETNTFSSVQIQNTGTANLTYSVVADSLPSWLSVNVPTGAIAPGQQAQMLLFFNTNGLSPHPAGTTYDNAYQGRVLLDTNDPLSARYAINLSLLVIQTAVEVEFSGEPRSGTVPLSVQFTDQTSINTSVTSTGISSWAWDFNGDGIIDSNLQNPLYTYHQPGTYNVKLSVTTHTGGTYHRHKNAYITVSNQAPVILNPLTVIDDMYEDTLWGPYALDTIFSDPDGHLLQYSAQNSEHISVLLLPGVFKLSAAQDWNGSETVSITATDPYGASILTSISVTVIPVNDAPVINMQDILYCIRNAPFEVDFADFIDDPDNPHSQLSLEIEQVAGNANIIPDYAPGALGNLFATFIITPDWVGTEAFMLHVNDNMGRIISSQEFSIEVLEHFTAQFEIVSDVSIQFAGQTVQFQDTTLGNPNTWSWSFGDGTVFSTLQNPSHSFMNAGTYSITLTVSNTYANETDSSDPQTLTFTGTAVTDDAVPTEWTHAGSPYNLVSSLEITPQTAITIQPQVQVNILGNTPLIVNGDLVATEVTFRAHNPGSRWEGLILNNNSSQTQLASLSIVDADLPLRIEGGTPSITNVSIANSSESVFVDGTALVLSGGTNATVSGLQIRNYSQGILLENQIPTRNSSPTLSNIRIQNSSSGSRTESSLVGIKISGDVDADLSDVVIEGYAKAIEIENDTASTSTPTMSNIRVSNSSSTSRNDESKGIVISGNSSPEISDVIIEDTDKAVIVDGTSQQSGTPSMSNIRIQNSSSGSRNTNTGITILGGSDCVLEDILILDTTRSIDIQNPSAQLSTPTMSNIRIRQSASGSRSETIGINSVGKIVLSIDDATIENCQTAIKYQGQELTNLSNTPTLSNIRIRNSDSGSRTLSTGMDLINIPRITVENDSIIGCSTGIRVSSDIPNLLSTPTLSNIRIQNSGSGSRSTNVGLYLGNNVGGVVENCFIETAGIGIVKTELNATILQNNKLRNCTIGIRNAGVVLSTPLSKQEIVLDYAYQMQNPMLDFVAFEALMSGLHQILNNTIVGYAKGLRAIDTNVQFCNNILWVDPPTQSPFESINSSILATYNNIAYAPGIYPGLGNINSNPTFMNPPNYDFTLHFNSPCIDAGLPIIFDSDGSVSDLGAYPYLHRASFVSSARFVSVGTTINFTNTSFGHEDPTSTTAWDIGADNIVESANRDYAYTFQNPGIYDIRLTMSSGNLVDTIILPSYIIVQNQTLQAPQNLSLIKENDGLRFSWDAVNHNALGEPLAAPVTYYLVYASDTIQGTYQYLTHVQNQTFATLPLSSTKRMRYFFVIGFDGNERQLRDFIENSGRSIAK